MKFLNFKKLNLNITTLSAALAKKQESAKRSDIRLCGYNIVFLGGEINHAKGQILFNIESHNKYLSCILVPHLRFPLLVRSTPYQLARTIIEAYKTYNTDKKEDEQLVFEVEDTQVSITLNTNVKLVDSDSLDFIRNALITYFKISDWSKPTLTIFLPFFGLGVSTIMAIYDLDHSVWPLVIGMLIPIARSIYKNIIYNSGLRPRSTQYQNID